jgi:hypothetical protein
MEKEKSCAKKERAAPVIRRDSKVIVLDAVEKNNFGAKFKFLSR